MSACVLCGVRHQKLAGFQETAAKTRLAPIKLPDVYQENIGRNPNKVGQLGPGTV